MIPLVFNCFVTADSPETKKLYDSIKLLQNNTAKVNLLIDLGYKYEFIDPDSAHLVYSDAISIARELTETELEAKARLWDGIVLNNLGRFAEAIDSYRKAQLLYKKIHSDPNVATCLMNIGNVHYKQSRYDSAIFYHESSLSIKEKSLEKKGDENSVRGLGYGYNNLGLIYQEKGDYSNSAAYYLKAIRLFDEIIDSTGLAASYTNLGHVHQDQENLNEALDLHRKAYRIYLAINDMHGIAISCNNMGVIYEDLNKIDSAFYYQNMSVEIKEQQKDNFGLLNSYSNLGTLAKDRYIAETENKAKRDLFERSKSYYNKALSLSRELDDKFSQSFVLCNLAGLLTEHASNFTTDKSTILNEAIGLAEESLRLAEAIGSLPQINNSSWYLMSVYKKQGSFEKALHFSELFMATKDSMFSEEKTKALTEMTTKYESEKKQLQIEKMEKEKELSDKTIEAQQAENRKQQIIIVSAIGGFIIVFIFSVIILRMFRQKKKANILLAQQNDEISQQKEEISTQRDEIEAQRDQVQSQKDQIEELYDVAVERKNIVEAQKEEIEDSIKYAKRIQTAVLPADKYAESILGEHFILFKPHSVVSGDFYWATQTEEWTIVTAADCTGHGVPGAFMSMLGVSFLNEIVRKKDVTTPADVLNQLRASVIEALKQTGEEGTQNTSTPFDSAQDRSLSVKDGMDMSIVAIHKDRRRALWAGANNPLYIVRPKKQDPNPKTQEPDNKKDSWGLELETLGLEFKEYKGDSMPVAVHVKMNDFTNHEINLNKGDLLYLFTDGFPDQFGGPKGKKFKYKPFKRLLVENSTKPMVEQKQALETALDEWMEGYEQVDDITVVGLKV